VDTWQHEFYRQALYGKAMDIREPTPPTTSHQHSADVHNFELDAQQCYNPHTWCWNARRGIAYRVNSLIKYIINLLFIHTTLYRTT
jgi:hypothetical protein